MSGVYVFLGPTLAVDRAMGELDAVYLPPVTEGAVYRLRHRRPEAIGIVDGSFNHARAVAHKEILWAMEQGVHVFGSAALGALRAAELAEFGMRGVGWIYDAFSSGALDRDDEVAVATQSESMVNIRRTLQRAHTESVISADTRGILLACGVTKFYRDRAWPGLLESGSAAGADPGDLAQLQTWLPEGRVDQQADDAMAMLREMREFIGANPERFRAQWIMARTTAWDGLKHRASSLPASNDPTGSGVPLDSLLDEIRLLGPNSFVAARDRSLLRHFAAAVVEREGLVLRDERLQDAIVEFRIENGLERGADFGKFLEDNDLTAVEFERLIGVQERVRRASARAEADALEELPDDLRMRGQYARLSARAAEKLQSNGSCGDDEVSSSEDAAIVWYFEQRLGMELPADLENYALLAGFADGTALRSAVLREYRYSRN